MIVEYQLSVTTAGGAGVSAGNNTLDSVPNGLLRAVYIPSGLPATTDWTFSYTNPAVNLFTFTNFNTAGWVVPFVPAYTLAGVAISNVGAPMPINRAIKLALAQADDGTFIIRFLIDQVTSS